ncbi:MAG TPA: hypothetical protein DDZ84_02140 [Firmicutes bacterium]|jgi:uncharacterized membrane protein|nr:hypothetical protein [Bacillota bacterium]
MNELPRMSMMPLTIVPLTLLVLGVTLKKWPPRQINSVYGFRTRESSRSPTKWKEANRLAADISLIGSLVFAVMNTVIFLCIAFANRAIAECVYEATPFLMLGLSSIFFIALMAYVQHRIKSIE